MKKLILIVMAMVALKGNAQSSNFPETAAIMGLSYAAADFGYSLSRKYYDPKRKTEALLFGMIMGVGLGMAVQTSRLRYDGNDTMAVIVGAGTSTLMRWNFDWEDELFGK